MKKNEQLIAFIILGVILVLAFTTNVFQSIAGGSTLSVSQVSINGQNQILMTASADGGGESWEGILNSYVEGVGVNPSDTFTLKIELDNQSCNYGISYIGEIVYSPTVSTQIFDGCYIVSQSGSIAKCTIAGFALNVCQVNDPISGVSCSSSNNACNWCYTYGTTPRYQKASPSSALTYLGWRVKATLTKGSGETIIQYLDPQTTEAAFGTIGRVKWTGNNVGNAICGTPYDVALIRPLSAQVWNKIPSAYYVSYQNAYNYYLSQQMSIVGGNQASNGLSAAISAMESQFSGQYSNQYNYQPVQNVVIPQLQFIFDANYFGVQIPKQGIPKIISLVSEPVYDVSSVNMKITVQNIGTQADSFDGSIVCDKQVTFTNNRISLNAGETGIILMPVQGFAGSYVCTIKVNSVNSPNNVDSSPFNFEISKRVCAFACCKDSAAYLDKACADTARTKNSVYTDFYGNVVYEACTELQHYDCNNYACQAGQTEIIQSTCSQVVIPPAPSGSPTPIPSVTPTPIPTVIPSPSVAPTPTPIVTIIASPSPTSTPNPSGTPTPSQQCIAIAVCAMNGVTYYNTCDAQNYGGGILHGGACTTPTPTIPPIGGGITLDNNFLLMAFGAILLIGVVYFVAKRRD